MAFTAVHILGIIPAPLLAATGGVHGLTIDTGGGAGRIRFLGSANLAAEGVVDVVEGAIMPPLVEVPPGGTLGWEMLEQVTSLATGSQDVQDDIDDIAEVGRAWRPAGVNREVRLDQRPLRVGDVAGVGLGSHNPFYAPKYPLWDSLSVPPQGFAVREERVAVALGADMDVLQRGTGQREVK